MADIKLNVTGNQPRSVSPEDLEKQWAALTRTLASATEETLSGSGLAELLARVGGQAETIHGAAQRDALAAAIAFEKFTPRSDLPAWFPEVSHRTPDSGVHFESPAGRSYEVAIDLSHLDPRQRIAAFEWASAWVREEIANAFVHRCSPVGLVHVVSVSFFEQRLFGAHLPQVIAVAHCSCGEERRSAPLPAAMVAPGGEFG